MKSGNSHFAAKPTPLETRGLVLEDVTEPPDDDEAQIVTIDELADAKPGVLRSDTVLTINTRRAQKLFIGRPRKVVDGKQVQAGIVGVRYFATLVRQVATGARADDPYADLMLIALDEEFEEARRLYATMRQEVEERVINRKAISVSAVQSVAPLGVKLMFSNPYAFRAAYLVADYDDLVLAIMQAQHMALMPRDTTEKKLALATRRARRVLSAPQRYRYSGACREDLRQMTARGRRAIDEYGPVPPEVLDGTRRPEFGAVHVAAPAAAAEPTAPSDEASEPDEAAEAAD